MEGGRHTQIRGLNRRAPWMTVEDIQLLMSLPAAQARAIEPLLHQQARSDLRFLTHNPVSLDAVAGARDHEQPRGQRRRLLAT